MNIAAKSAQPSLRSMMNLQMEAGTGKPPFLGFGLGLRAQHYDEILSGNPPIDWFEVIGENYVLPGGQPLRMLDKIRECYPIVMHGVSLSIASTASPNFEYLQGLRHLARRIEPKWISDHLCWTGVHGKNLHDLLPIRYTREALDHFVSRVQLDAGGNAEQVIPATGETVALHAYLYAVFGGYSSPYGAAFDSDSKEGIAGLSVNDVAARLLIRRGESRKARTWQSNIHPRTRSAWERMPSI